MLSTFVITWVFFRDHGVSRSLASRISKRKARRERLVQLVLLYTVHSPSPEPTMLVQTTVPYVYFR